MDGSVMVTARTATAAAQTGGEARTGAGVPIGAAARIVGATTIAHASGAAAEAVSAKAGASIKARALSASGSGSGSGSGSVNGHGDGIKAAIVGEVTTASSIGAIRMIVTPAMIGGRHVDVSLSGRRDEQLLTVHFFRPKTHTTTFRFGTKRSRNTHRTAHDTLSLITDTVRTAQMSNRNPTATRHTVTDRPKRAKRERRKFGHRVRAHLTL